MNDLTGKGDDGGGILGLVLLWILFGAFLLLIISPIDVIPEALMGPVGWIDDIIYGVVDLLIGALIYSQTKRRRKVKRDAGEKDITPETKGLSEGEEVPELPEAVETEESETPDEK